MKIKLVKAFTQDPSQGNPAGVLLNADTLNDLQRQSIATELNFSESAFVEVSDKADFRVRFFSPLQEVDFCGHATVATFYALLKEGIKGLTKEAPVILTQETNIGVLKVKCFYDGKIMMAQQAPQFSEVFEDRAEIAKLLGLQAKDLLDLPLQIVSTGARQLIIPVKNRKILQNIKPDLAAITAHSKKYNHAGACVITPAGFTASGDIATRNFAPVFGINEDAATGIAAGAIGWYGNKYLYNNSQKALIIEQGFDMAMNSTIYVDIAEGTNVGGYAAIFGEQEV